MIDRIAVANYRSLRDLRVSLGPLTVVTGPNGSGKSSLYRALRLLAEVGQGRVVGALAIEGGLAATLWAGPERLSAGMVRGDVPVQGTRRTAPIALKLGFAGPDFGYAIDLGLPVVSRVSAFVNDPEIKSEELWLGPVAAPRTLLAARKGPSVRLRSAGTGAWRQIATTLASHDSMLTHAAGGDDGHEVLALRERLRGWRFYDAFRTDRDAPARQPQIGTRTPVLAGDGADLAAAAQTILEMGDGAALQATVEEAFAGAKLEVTAQDGRFALGLRQPGLLRPMGASDLSDGTLRYLLLAAALLSPRPPALLVLNEPEASLHPDLLIPLGRLIAKAAERSQVVVITHSGQLAGRLDGVCAIALEKRLGETAAPAGDRPAWTWPAR